MKPDLIILHGALGCSSQFTEWVKELSVNCNCHTMDFTGHGTDSANSAEFSIALFSEDLRKYIKKQGLQKPKVLGYSMGGYVALFTALHEEELLGDIMTLATKFDWNAESSKKEAGYLKPELMMQKVPQLVEQLKHRHGSHWESVVEKTASMMIALGEKPLLTQQNIKEIKNQIRFCVGEKDKMVSMAETESMFNSSVNGTLRVLPNTAHLPETMDLKLIVTEVKQFLSASKKH